MLLYALLCGEGQVRGREVSMVAINYLCLRRAFGALLWIAVLKQKSRWHSGRDEGVHLSNLRSAPIKLVEKAIRVTTSYYSSDILFIKRIKVVRLAMVIPM